MPKKPKQRIRPLAICVFRHADRILVAEGFDSVKQGYFYRPLGGAIEFGETAAETIQRELMEEIQQPVEDLRYLGTLENIFFYEGAPGHEIVMVFDGRFVNEWVYAAEKIEGVEDEMNQHGEPTRFTGLWKSLSFFRENRAPLYPDGLLDLLESKKNRS